MNSTTWWILAGTIPVSLIIMVISMLVVRAKISVIKKNYGSKKNLLHRENRGELLWDLKDKTKNPLDDYVLDFLINTCLKNKYKCFNTIGFLEKYEEKTLEKIAKLKKVTKNYDFLLINFDEGLIDKIHKIYKQIKQNSLIAIVNINNRKNQKKFVAYLKLIDFRHEFQKIGNGIILIAK